MTSDKNDYFNRVHHFLYDSQVHFEQNFRLMHKIVHIIMKHHNIWDISAHALSKHPKIKEDIRRFGVEFSYHVMEDMERLANSIRKDMHKQAGIFKKRHALEKKKTLTEKADIEFFKQLLRDQLYNVANNTQRLRNVKWTLKSLCVHADKISAQLATLTSKSVRKVDHILHSY